MAASCEGGSADEQWQRGKQVNDGLFEMYRPASGSVNLEIIFFYGFPREESDEGWYFRTWMKADDSACWLNTLLAEAFPQARIFCIYYGTGITKPGYRGQMDTYLLGENLAQSIVTLGGIGQDCPVILVGHCVGGFILKEVCLQAEKYAGLAGDQHKYKYSNFLQNLKVTVFYGTPHFGSQAEPTSSQGGPLRDYLRAYNVRVTRINSEFSTLRREYGWETAGICETSETITGIQKAILGSRHSSRLVVGEQSARSDMDLFIALPAKDHFDICRPVDRTSTSFLFLEEILEAVCKKEVQRNVLFKWDLQLPEVLGGASGRVEEVVKRLQLQAPSSLPVILVGMGGIGKTTLAKQVVLKISHLFEFICFVENAQQKLASSSFRSLVCSHLHKRSGTKVPLHEDEVLIHISGRKILMVIDDLNSRNEKEHKILKLWDSYFRETGSRLIVTSQDRSVTTGAIVHEVPFLSGKESRELFEAHFPDGVPEEIPGNLIGEIVDRCSGLPLGVEVMGSYLNGTRDVSSWRAAVCRLEMAAPLDGGNVKDDRLWRILRLSYENLGELEQRMFLDLAGFDMYGPKLTQYGVDVLKVALELPRSKEVLSHVTLKNLERRSLVRLLRTGWSGNEQKVYIHQQLRDMAKGINRPVHERPELCRGLWDIEDVEMVLGKYKEEGIANTELLSLLVDSPRKSPSSGSSSEESPLQFHWEAFAKLERMRLLRISNVSMTESGGPARFPNSLVMVHMINCSKSRAWSQWWLGSKCWPIRKEDVPLLSNLAVLLLENCDSVHFPENLHELSGLRIFRIRLSDKRLKKLPESIGFIPVLEDLSIESPGLELVPCSLLQSRSLRTLTIKNCTSLQAWASLGPIPTVPNLPGCGSSLTELRLKNLPLLKELPEAFGQMKCLARLVLKKCSALQTLPESFGGLLALRHLSIVECSGLSSLPESFGGLLELSFLDIVGCSGLSTIPESFGHLPQLYNLTIRSCLGLESLCQSFGQLSGIHELHLQNLPRLSAFPASFPKTISIPFIKGCDAVRVVPKSFGEDLQNLVYLNLYDCKASFVYSITAPREESASSVRPCDAEASAVVRRDSGAAYTHGRLQSQGAGLAALHGLMEGSNTASLHSSLRLFENLKMLVLRHIDGLKDDFLVGSRFRNLTCLSICHCNDLVRLPESICQTKLTILDIYSCEKFEGLPDRLGDFATLKRLMVTSCRKFKGFPPSIGNLVNLQCLHILFCEDFTGLPEDLEEIGQLTWFTIFCCEKFKGLPKSFRRDRIRHLDICYGERD